MGKCVSNGKGYFDVYMHKCAFFVEKIWLFACLERLFYKSALKFVKNFTNIFK